MSSVQPVAYDPGWPAAYEQEAQRLRHRFGDVAVWIEHIGSTAVPGCAAKPVIDLLVAATSLVEVDRLSASLAAAGYDVRGENGLPGRRYFRLHSAAGVRTHHIHVYREGDAALGRHLAFRDYLRTHPERSAAYSALKAWLVTRGLGGAEYQAGKAAMVAEIEAEALAWRARMAT